jgi:hypothetical protein
MRRCVMVMQEVLLLSLKFGAKSSHIFRQSAWNVTVVRGISLQARILCEQSPRCRRKCWACSWLFSSPVSPIFGLRELGLSVYDSCFPLLKAYLIISRAPVTHFRDLHKIWCFPLSNPSRNFMRPIIWLQIKGRNKPVHLLSSVKFC